MVDLSIIIVNWNTAGLLENCLSSLKSGVRKYSLEVFVVDNGSTDQSVVMVRELFPDVRLIENKTNEGFARANNQAMRVGMGKYVLLLNSDTVLTEGCIDRLVDAMEGDAKIGIAGAQLLNSDGSFQNSIAHSPSLLTELTNKSLLRMIWPDRYRSKVGGNADVPVEVESVIGACMMVRREVIERVGYLDEDYFFFLEETDWCLRARRAGWQVVCVPGCRVRHLQGSSAGRVIVGARIEYWRSRYLFFKKHHGLTTRIILRVGLLVKLVVGMVLNTFVGIVLKNARRRAGVYLRITAWHVVGCPRGWGLKPR